MASLPSRGLTRTIRAASPSTAASKTSSWLGGQLPHLDPPCSPTNTRTADQLYKSTPGGFEHIACRFRSARCHRQPLPQAPEHSHSPSLVKWAASGCVTVRCAAPSSGARQSDVNVAQPRQCGVSAHRRNVPTVPGSSHHYPAPVQAGPTPAASPAARAERRFGARPEPSRCGGHARSDRQRVFRFARWPNLRRILVGDDWRRVGHCGTPFSKLSRSSGLLIERCPLVHPPWFAGRRCPVPRQGRRAR